MNQIIIKLEGNKVFSYTLWKRIEHKNDYNVVKKVNNHLYGMVGTETRKVNFDEIQKEVIETIQKEYPQTRNGKIKFCAIEIEKVEDEK